MRLRSVSFAAFAAAAVMQSCQPACTPPPEPGPPPPPEISSITISGQGSGHGRGMSAWGAYGAAVNRGWDSARILDHYYGGTGPGAAGNEVVGVRLTALDDAASTVVMSTSGRALWGGAAYGALWAEHVGSNTYDVYGSPTAACPGAAVEWWPLGRSTGPITFSTDVDETAAAPGDVLGLCQPNGRVIHYRGTITAVDDNGQRRTANHLLVEDYLKGVMSRELPSSWGHSGGGRGMHALRAFAVAQRSFALTQSRYRYADTCDTASCQVYGGSAHRANPAAPTSWPGAAVCETGNPTFECATTNRAVAETAGATRVWPDGRMVSTEYSASHGDRSAGGSFPVVEDLASDVPQNPNYRWTRTLDAAALEAHYGLGDLVGVWSEREPGSIYDGHWGHRVVLQGTTKTVTIANLPFRNTWGFPSHGFVVSSANR